MKTSIYNVHVLFDGKCPKCGTVSGDSSPGEQGNSVKTTIAGLLESGVPMCDDCDAELAVLEDCVIVS